MLVLEQISKSWGALQVLDAVSMTVPGDAITGLIGPNGAGKSTLFGAISGVVPVDAGSIRFGAAALDRLDAVRRARAGLLRTFQVPRPFAHLSVRANLAVAAGEQSGESLLNVFLRPAQVRRREAEIEDAAEQIIQRLKLSRVADSAAGKLSGGQLKLLELGRLLMGRPKLILLDEPLAGVNPVLAEEIADCIRGLHAGGLGFFIIEHDLSALSRLASRLFALDRGRLIASGTPDEVLSDIQVRESYIGS